MVCLLISRYILICRRTCDISRKKKEKDETSKIDSKQTQKDGSEKDKLITNLQNKLG